MSFLYPQVWEPGASVWDVVAIQNNMLALISNNHPQPYKKNILNIIIENEKEEMIELKSYFQEMERQFLKEVGCNTMEEFLKKVEEWNSSGAVTMMQNPLGCSMRKHHTGSVSRSRSGASSWPAESRRLIRFP